MTAESNLIISEVFYSIQGEGQTMGSPAVFLRLTGCNLFCRGDKWVCDTVEKWRKGKTVPFNSIISPYYIRKMKNGAHLVITGGEPMLQQQAISRYLKWFEDKHGFLPIVEIETNGTIKPLKHLLNYVHFWNVSPKLSITGGESYKRFNKTALAMFSMLKGQVVFKFVISRKEDAVEVFKDFTDIIGRKKIVFMPSGDNRKELNRQRGNVIRYCLSYGVRYCDRLQVVAWDKEIKANIRYKGQK